MQHHAHICFASVPVVLRRRSPRASVSLQEGVRVSQNAGLTRRAFVSIGAAAVAGAVAHPVLADDISSLVTPYKDLPKGFTILRPNGWNEFEATPDAYDIKWQDIIQPLEFVTVLTNNVSKDKTLVSIGSAQAVGKKLAQSRGGELISASEKDIDGIPAYVFEIKKGSSHQLTLLTVNKNKLYSVNASSPENRWRKRQRLLRGVVDSFQPKL